MPTTHVMKVSRNGQVSIPADARGRWQVERVLVVDLGDRVVMRPMPADPMDGLVGKYRGRGPSTSTARQFERSAEARRERRRAR